LRADPSQRLQLARALEAAGELKGAITEWPRILPLEEAREPIRRLAEPARAAELRKRRRLFHEALAVLDGVEGPAAALQRARALQALRRHVDAVREFFVMSLPPVIKPALGGGQYNVVRGIMAGHHEPFLLQGASGYAGRNPGGSAQNSYMCYSPEGVISVHACLIVLFGYLAGSVLPAYLLARWLRGIDIREVGTRHAGAMNVKAYVGLGPALMTAAFDASKGVAVILAAERFFQASAVAAYLGGLAAIAGHVLPFHLRFRGGRGAATATGILILALARLLPGYGAWAVVSDASLIVFLIGIVRVATSKEDFLSVTVLPVLACLLLIRVPWGLELGLALVVITHILVVSVQNIVRHGLVKTAAFRHPDLKVWRLLARPLALAISFLSYEVPRSGVLAFIGSLLTFSLVTDVARIWGSRLPGSMAQGAHWLGGLSREQERDRLSSVTLLFLGCLLSLLAFEREISVAAMTFLILGGPAAKIIGLTFGKRRFLSKTVEGTSGHLAVCLVAGYLLSLNVGIPLAVALPGAVTASLIEAVPWRIDDNLSVPLVSGFVMFLASNLPYIAGSPVAL
jgi:glycerol-3-phosphate acyltransferase PlsY